MTSKLDTIMKLKLYVQENDTSIFIALVYDIYQTHYTAAFLLMVLYKNRLGGCHAFAYFFRKAELLCFGMQGRKRPVQTSAVKFDVSRTLTTVCLDCKFAT